MAPQSPDLNPLDYWFWGSVVAEVQKQNPTTIEDLMTCVDTVSQDISPNQVFASIKNIFRRMQLCQSVNGGHFQHLL